MCIMFMYNYTYVHVHTYNYLVYMYVHSLCLKICPNCFPIFTYHALHVPHHSCIML